jgi:hypothetical protein
MVIRPVSVNDGRRAVRAWLAGDRGEATVATAVRFALEELAERSPGRGIEVRVPPYGAVQCGGGSRHTRGTPPRVVEADAETWLGLATGSLSWPEGVAGGRVVASGVGSSLEPWLPVVGDCAVDEDRG